MYTSERQKSEICLSICITVYNQLELVKRNLQTILQYPGNDIEIVISDDFSTDDIKGMVDSFCDKRIKYYRTPLNMGHDLNILFALRHCKSDFAFLLRSRDLVIPTEVEYIINCISRYPETAYMGFSARNVEHEVAILYSDCVYHTPRECIEAHFRLLVHPSGQLYNVKYLDFCALEGYIKKYFKTIYGFVVHDLIRMQLALKGDFLTFERATWVYDNNRKNTDRAVNATKNKTSVYAPEYSYPRYECEFFYITDIFPEDEKIVTLKHLIAKFCKSIIWDYSLSNRDVYQQQHYAYEEVAFSRYNEYKNFYRYTICLSKDFLKTDKKELCQELKKQKWYLFLHYPLKYYMQKIFKLLVKNKGVFWKIRCLVKRI